MPAKATLAPRKTLASVAKETDHRLTQLERDVDTQRSDLSRLNRLQLGTEQSIDRIVTHRLQEAWLLAGLFIATNGLTLLLHFLG